MRRRAEPRPVRKQSLLIFDLFVLGYGERPFSLGVGQRGAVRLYIDGFAFVKNHTTTDHILWKCAKKVISRLLFDM